MTGKEVNSQSNDQAVDFLAINKPSLDAFLLRAQSSSQNSVFARESDLVYYRLEFDNDVRSLRAGSRFMSVSIPKVSKKRGDGEREWGNEVWGRVRHLF